jgi:hypothetical protein
MNDSRPIARCIALRCVFWCRVTLLQIVWLWNEFHDTVWLATASCRVVSCHLFIYHDMTISRRMAMRMLYSLMH